MAPLPTFDVATADPSVLRTVARSAASPSARGDELMLVASNSAGGALALNALLGLEALGYRHALLVAYERELCTTLGDAVGRVPARSGSSLDPAPSPMGSTDRVETPLDPLLVSWLDRARAAAREFQ